MLVLSSLKFCVEIRVQKITCDRNVIRELMFTPILGDRGGRGGGFRGGRGGY